MRIGLKQFLFASIFFCTIIAGSVLIFTKAATPTASLEPEQGSLNGAAVAVVDQSASGGQAVQFASTAMGVGVTNCGLNAAAKTCWQSGTGVQNGTGFTEAQIVAGQSSLTKHVGDVIITTNGTVIDHQWIEGCIAVRANNVTIKNSLIHTTDGCSGGDQAAGASLVNDGTSGTTGLQIIDTEIDAMNANYDLSGGPQNNYTCLRCNIHGAAHNLWAADHVTIQDSFLHDLTTSTSSGHTESIDADSAAGPVLIQHNWIQALDNGPVTGAIFMGNSWGPVTGVTIRQNYLEGGAGADIGGGSNITQTSITNNAFSPNNGYGGSQYIYGFSASGTGNTWSNNYRSDTLAPLATP